MPLTDESAQRILNHVVPRIVGVVVLLIGIATAAFFLRVAERLLIHGAPGDALWMDLIVFWFFGTIAAVLITAGIRWAFRDPAGSMLPPSLWLVLGLVFVVSAIVGPVVVILQRRFDHKLLESSLVMALFAWCCFRFAQRRRTQ
jgi:hypothetical protein